MYLCLLVYNFAEVGNIIFGIPFFVVQNDHKQTKMTMNELPAHVLIRAEFVNT